MKKTFSYLTVLTICALSLSACGNPKPEASVPAANNKTTASSKISFEKEIGLNEEVAIEFQLMEGTEKKTGKASFKAKEFGEKDKIGQTSPIAGQTFYYLVYDFKGDAANSSTAQPKIFVDPSAPQIVLIDENTMPSIGGAMGGAYNSNVQEEMGLQAFELLPMNQADWVSTVTTWYTTKVEKPMAALQYTDASGNKKYIKINY